jgi:alpha-tubulin suppressor-like RCC1 family protein
MLCVIASCAPIVLNPLASISLAKVHPADSHRAAAAVIVAGTVWAWGLGNFGQLGNGTCDPNLRGGEECASSATPVEVKGLVDVVAVAEGDWTSYALRRDGTVWAWGLGADGALGDGDPRCRPDANATYDCPASDIPVKVKDLSGVTAIAADDGSGYALRRDGTVWAWGSGTDGALGDGDPLCTHQLLLNAQCPSSDVPVRVKGLTHVVSIAGGSSSAYALSADGTVWAWGSDLLGQLGTGNCSSTAASEGKCPGSDKPVAVKGLTNAVAVFSGGAQGFVLRPGDRVWAWGTQGAVACAVTSTELDNTCPPDDVPVELKALIGARSIAATGDGAYALEASGTVWAWGGGGSGELGNGACHASVLAESACAGSAVPVRVEAITDATAVAAGDFDAFALLRDGTVWGWGAGTSGELGTGNCGGAVVVTAGARCTNRDVPARVKGLAGVLAIAAKGATGLAIRG